MRDERCSFLLIDSDEMCNTSSRYPIDAEVDSGLAISSGELLRHIMETADGCELPGMISGRTGSGEGCARLRGNAGGGRQAQR